MSYSHTHSAHLMMKAISYTVELTMVSVGFYSSGTQQKLKCPHENYTHKFDLVNLFFLTFIQITEHTNNKAKPTDTKN